MNGSGGATDLANNDLADYADQSVAKKTDTPRSSINTQRERWEDRERVAGTQCYHMQNNSCVKFISGLYFLHDTNPNAYVFMVKSKLQCFN